MRDDRVYLGHILDAIGLIESYTRSGREEFFTNPLVRDAVLRNLEVIGEAVKNLADAVRARAPQVPWRRIAGLRDVLVHQYFGVSLPLVWEVVEQDLPELRRQVEALLAAEGPWGSSAP